MELYSAAQAGQTAQLPTLPVQYADYAIWQRKHFAGDYLAQQLDWWTAQLKGISPLELPTDFPRPAVQSNRGASFRWQMDRELKDSLNALALKEGATLFMTLQAALQILLYRYSGQNDICLGTPVANRIDPRLESLVGFFINTLVLRTQIDGAAKFVDLLEQVKGDTLDAMAHQEVPFEQIVERVEKDRSRSRSPIFQVLFTLQNAPDVANLDLGESSISSEPIGEGAALFDLSFSMTENTRGLEVGILYCSDLFSATTIERMAQHFELLLRSLTAAPDQAIDQLSMLGKVEQTQLLETFNDTQRDYPLDQTVVAAFEKQAAKNPQQVALSVAGINTNYGELNQRSNQLAHHLLQAGLQVGDRVAICLDRSREMVVAMMAVLKAGAAYVPVDPNYPDERITFILADCEASYVISETDHLSRFNEYPEDKIIAIDQEWSTIEQQASSNPDLRAQADDLAYLIYTSGSTGKPKGVMLGHRSLSNFLYSMQEDLQADSAMRLLAVTTYSFDISILEIFLPLVAGGQIVLATGTTASDALALQQVLKESEATHMQATPATWQLLVDGDWKNETGITILTGGEAIKEQLKNTLTSWGDYPVWNCYGPTETTIWSSLKQLQAAEKVNIGRPLANTQVYILNQVDSTAPQLAPLGVVGELCIAGEGLAKAYWNRPELTATRFIADPFSSNPKARMYRTGDLARWLPNGELECLGRMDDQVKVRGYRIELGEIESILSTSPQVRACAVVANQDEQNITRLVAYVVPEENLAPDALRAHLQTQLPDYMVPSVWQAIETLPLTPAGKTDKKALSRRKVKVESGRAYEAPQTALELKLAQIWEDLLGVERVGRNDNFFELGGHSILVIKLVARICNAFGIELTVNTIFESPSLQDQALHLGVSPDLSEAEGTFPLLSKLNNASDRPPLFLVPGVMGNTMIFMQLAQVLEQDFEVHSFQASGLDGHSPLLPTVEAMAEAYIEELLAKYPRDSYQLGGFSFGTDVALEIASQLRDRGYGIEPMVIFDSLIPWYKQHSFEVPDGRNPLWMFGRHFARKYGFHDEQSGFTLHWYQSGVMEDKTLEEQYKIVYERIKELGVEVSEQFFNGHADVFLHHCSIPRYLPNSEQKLDCDILLFTARPEIDYGWQLTTTGQVTILDGHTSHAQLLRNPRVSWVGEQVVKHLLNR